MRARGIRRLLLRMLLIAMRVVLVQRLFVMSEFEHVRRGLVQRRRARERVRMRGRRTAKTMRR